MAVFLAQISSLIFGNGGRLEEKKLWFKGKIFFKIEVLRRGVYIWWEQTRVKWDRAEVFWGWASEMQSQNKSWMIDLQSLQPFLVSL